MAHYYEKNIVDIKNEYTDFLINILTPLIHEGIKSIYNKAVNLEEAFRQRVLEDPSVENPGVFKLFQICLRDIPNLNSASIENEVNRIKERSKCSEWFENLLKSTIKSHIVLLTFNSKKKKSKVVEEKFHDKIDTNLFIHKCYIEASRLFFNYPELFWHHFSTLDIKRNQREIYELIKIAIREAIRKSLPIKHILDEYLQNDYDYEDYVKSEEKRIKIRKMIESDNIYMEAGEEMNDDNQDSETETESETVTETVTETVSQYLPINKIINTDEQEEINEQIENIEGEIKESDKIEKQEENLLSHLSHSVSVDNLLLHTTENVESPTKIPTNINKKNTLLPNAEKSKNNDVAFINLKSSGKKNENRFFLDELTRYKLTKAPEPVQVTKQTSVPQQLSQFGGTPDLEIKKNNTGKNEFFNSIMK